MVLRNQLKIIFQIFWRQAFLNKGEISVPQINSFSAALFTVKSHLRQACWTHFPLKETVKIVLPCSFLKQPESTSWLPEMNEHQGDYMNVHEWLLQPI